MQVACTCPARYRFAMWVDIAITSISVLNDPMRFLHRCWYSSWLCWQRYALRDAPVPGITDWVFRRRDAGSQPALHGDSSSVSPGLVFLNLFGGIILLYAYILMGRIELSRAQLEQRSRLDTLTGLMNRRGLLEWAEELFKHLSRDRDRLVVMFADLDKFKSINDTRPCSGRRCPSAICRYPPWCDPGAI